MKRAVAIVALTFSALVSAGLGVAWAAFRTDAGRGALTRYLSATLNDALDGSVTIGSIGGSMLEGLVIEDVVIRDTSGVLLARLPRVVARYRLADLVSRRVVLGQVIVTDPHVNILKRERGGRFNYQDVLRLGRGDGNGGPSPLVAFEDAEIHRAIVEIRTPSDPLGPGDRHVVQDTEFGLMRYRRIDSLSARLSYVRLVSPRERGQRFDVSRLEGRFSDPALDIRSLEGRLDIAGDSFHLELDRFELPESLAEMRGFLKWPTGKLEVGLDIDARLWAIDDLATFSQSLPWGMTGRGVLQLRSPNPDSLSIRISPMRLRGGGGQATGSLGVTVSRGDVVEFRNTDLRFENLDLEFLRPMLDTIPFAGRLTGDMTAHGPSNLLTTSVDWTFRDSLVGDWPESYVRGEGFVALGGNGTTFLNFVVDTARLDTRTLQRLFPAVEVQGFLGGAMGVAGLWKNAELSGRFWHEYADMPISRGSGRLRFDAQTDTLGVYAELGFDSLYLASVRPSYPALPPTGTLVGRVALAGTLDSLPFVAALGGPGGRFDVEGDFVLTSQRLAVRNLDAQLRGVDVAAFYPALLPTELAGRVQGAASRDSAQPGRSRFEIRLGESYVTGTPLDSGSGSVAIADSVVRSDYRMWGPNLSVTVAGSFGLAPSRRGIVTFGTDVDSIGTIAPLLTTIAPVLAAESVLTNVAGGADLRVRLEGSTAHYAVDLQVAIPAVVSDAGLAEGVAATASWSTAFDQPMRVQGVVDSLTYHSLAFSDLGIELDGTKGVSDWFAWARLGLEGSAVAWGKSYANDQVVILPLDSVAVLLPENVWMLRHPAVVSVSDSGFLFSEFTLESAVDPRPVQAAACHERRPAVTLEGLFPTNGSAELTADLAAVPVRDLAGLIQSDPTRYAGSVCGRVLVGGTAPAPVMTSTMTLRDGRFGRVSVPSMAGQLAYRDRRLSGESEISDGDDVLTRVTFSLPLDLALQGVTERRVPGPLRVSARADSVDLRFVELLTETVVDVGGTLHANFGVRGTWEEPVLAGTMAVENATARYPELGVTHRALTGGVHLTGDSIVIDSLRAESGQGLVSAVGSIRLEGLRRPLLDIRFNANEFHTANIEGLVDFTTSGTVDLDGPVLGATLTGSGTVTEGVLYFADLIEKEIINLEDTLYAELLDEELQALIQREGLGADFENRFLDSLRISGLQLIMGRSVWLRSTQANVQLGGRLSVDKVGDTYRYDGTLNTPRGTYRLPLVGASQDFSVTNGEVLYFGTPDLNAVLNINAERLVRPVDGGDNLTVFVNIGGTLNEPEVTLTSDREPPLPQTELISYLLVGAPRLGSAYGSGANTRPFGAVGAGAINALVGEVSSQVERALISDLGVPIDYLRVRWEGVGGAELSFGRRIGDRLFLIAKPSICWEESSRTLGAARVEYRFADNWSWSLSRDAVATCGTSRLTSQLGSIYQFGTDLIWQRRY